MNPTVRYSKYLQNLYLTLLAVKCLCWHQLFSGIQFHLIPGSLRLSRVHERARALGRVRARGALWEMWVNNDGFASSFVFSLPWWGRRQRIPHSVTFKKEIGHSQALSIVSYGGNVSDIGHTMPRKKHESILLHTYVLNEFLTADRLCTTKCFFELF